MFALHGGLKKAPGEARNLGSIVAEIAMVATGGFQYAVFGGPKLWDVAAGAVIVREAGGVALIWQGNRWQPIDTFEVPRSEQGKKPKTLRDWSRPTLVAGPGAAGHVGGGLAPRKALPGAIRWAMKQRRSARDWWRKRRDGEKPPAAAKPAATVPEASP
jgi:hypothetical protein